MPSDDVCPGTVPTHVDSLDLVMAHHCDNCCSPGKIRYIDLTVEQRSFLSRLTYYIWWQSAEESLELPERLIAQIMDTGWPSVPHVEGSRHGIE